MHPKTHPLAIALSAALALSPFAPRANALSAADSAAAALPQANAPARYLIQLREPALAGFRGDGSLAAPSRIAGGARKGRIDLGSAASQAYARHLAEQQAASLAGIERQLGRPLPTIARLRHALNGVVVELTPAEAARVAARGDVARVEADRTLSLDAEPDPSFIGADTIWDGSASGGLATQGEGIVIGMIDSGINWQSPSFAAVGPSDGYRHVNPLGTGRYLGSCGDTAPNPDLGHCNDKLIGMYNFANATASADDSIGHGSHTASTAGGNHRIVDAHDGTFAIAGIAPHANLVMFSCFNGGGCSSVAAAQAADQAVAGGLVDVISFSVAGGAAPWSDMVSQAFLGATEAGIFVAAAAGNDGPDAQSVNHVEPWVATVAASTLDYTTGFDFSLDLPGAPLATQHIGVHPGQPPVQAADISGLPIVRSPTFDNTTADGCSAFAPGTFAGALAVLRLHTSTSSCGSVQRKANADAAGAAGVLFVDATTYIPVGASGSTWSMLLSDWENVWAAMQANPGAATASIRLPLSLYPDTGDHIAEFSGRGPTVAGDLAGQYLLKPDLSAPGVMILAAYIGSADAVDFMDGTSMATPHVAGAAALLRAVHPDWTPMELKSALATTAWTNDIVSQWGGPTTIWDRGSGRVDLGTAVRAGLLLDENGANFRAADPALGNARLVDLNLSSAVMGACSADDCRFTRRLRNPLGIGTAWSATLDGLSAASVSPAQFTLAPGATQDVTVSINPATLAGAWTFAELRLAASSADIPDAHLPIAVKRNGGAPLLLLSTSTLDATLAPDATATRALTLVNAGTGAIHWSVDTSSPGCAKPAWAGYSPTSGTLLSGGSPRTLTVALDAHGLPEGAQAATLCIASDDATLPLAKVDLALTVESADAIFHDGFDGD